MAASKLPFAVPAGLVLLCASLCLAAQQINLVIVEGEGAINNIKLRTARETIVKVEDENHKPVAGAVVVFLLPNDGPGGAFFNGDKTSTVTTDEAGQARMPRLQMNSWTGPFSIQIHASFQGLEANATVSQSSVSTGGGISTGAKVGIVAGIAAVGAVVAVAVSKGGGSSSNSSTAPPSTTPASGVSGSIGIGSGATLGPPH